MNLTTPTTETIYGHFVSLSGTVATHQAGVAVTVLAQPFGAAAFAPVATALTGDGGIWSYPAQPKLRTVYEVTALGGTSSQVTIGVRPADLAPDHHQGTLFHAGRRREPRSPGASSSSSAWLPGGKWKTVARARLNANSAAIFRAATLPTGTLDGSRRDEREPGRARATWPGSAACSPTAVAKRPGGTRARGRAF